MFDTYQVGPRSIHADVHHTEHRAPTDESVRLLREMEAKAREQVVEAMRLTSATVEAVVHRFDDPMDCRTHFKLFYKVNGHKREVTLWTEDRAKIMDKLDAIWKAIADDLATFLTQDIAKGFSKREY